MAGGKLVWIISIREDNYQRVLHYTNHDVESFKLRQCLTLTFILACRLGASMTTQIVLGYIFSCRLVDLLALACRVVNVLKVVEFDIIV